MITDKKIVNNISNRYNLGYYSVGDLFSFNKSEALRFATSNPNLNVSYHYFDEHFQSLNINKEIHFTLEELYAQRAQQLRDKYDYLILSFSGGSDSTNILDTFLKNNIKLDEIATFYPLEAIDKFYKNNIDLNDRSNKNLALEYIGSVEPKLKQVSLSHPDIKITVMDNSQETINIIDNQLVDKLEMGSGVVTSPSCSGHYMMGNHLRSLTDRLKGKTVGYITGVDKPRMGYNRNARKLGVFFDDMSNTHGNFLDTVLGGFKPNIEHFYYSTEFSDVWIKQCQILKNVMIPILTSDPSPDFYKMLHIVSQRKNEIFDVHNDFFKKILYKNWDLNIFQARKPTSGYYHQMAYWFFNADFVSNRTKDFYEQQINERLYGIDNARFVNREKDTGKLIRLHVMRSKALHVWDI